MKHYVILLLLVLPFLTSVVLAEELAGDLTVEKPELYVQCSDSRAIEVDFIFPGVSYKSIFKGAQAYDVFEVEHEGSSGTIGAPEVPIITRLFAIPDRARVIIKKFEPTYKTYQGIFAYPHQDYEYDSPFLADEWVFDEKYYQQGEVFPESWVSLSEPAILRDFRIIPVNISPIRINATTGEVQVLTGLHLELEFDNGATTNIKTHHFDKIVGSYDKMYRNLISNYDWVNPNGEYVKGSLLIIYPNVSNVSTIIAPLIEWKKRRGYATTAVSVANNSSTTTIQNIIQTAYSTYDPPLESVILIGDADGTLDVPCYYYSGGSSDHNYTTLEGGDVLADISIGRYSVSGTTNLMTAVNKVLYYEKTPISTSTGWYKKGAVTAGSGSGISTVMISKNIRYWWLDDGYTQVDTMYYNMGGSIPTFITNECNAGITSFNYRGYVGVSGFDVNDVYALTNTYKLPYAVIVTCGTGDFGSSGADMSESWLRAGTPTNPTGGIGGVGTATSSTHTRFNNTVCLGTWFALSYENLSTLGEMLFRGKYELFINYQFDQGGMNQFTYWNNLMGDPTTDIWNDIPKTLVVEHPDSIPVGTSTFTVTVHDTAGNPLADRYVNLWKGTETYVGGTTDANGVFTAPISVPTTGGMYVTVTHHNDRPYLATVPVYNCAVYPSYYSLTIDDDNVGASSGNGNGIANPSEVLELGITLKNYGTSTTAYNVSATLSSTDSNITIINATSTYPDMGAGATAVNNNSFVVDLGSNFNQGYLIPFTLTVASAQGTFVSAFNMEVSSGQCNFITVTVTGGTLEPGETDQMTLTIKNVGELALTNVSATLSSTDPQVTIVDNLGNFGNINPNQQATNASNTFSVAADQYATVGRMVDYILHLSSANGCEQDITFDFAIGAISSDDPIGPDSYGYYCLDNTDVEYSGHPDYNWVEVVSTGTHIYLPDWGNEQDCSARINLPFNFQFYGESFDALTVCSNGWLAFGDQTYFVDFRNYCIPSAGGAGNGMLCPLWDNLVMGSGGVYYYYDATNHRFIVEYSHTPVQYGGDECFEVILYDPAYYPTPTGDGEIAFQYMVFNAVYGTGSDNPYCTVGIENHEHSDGIQYSYWNAYAPGAATLGWYKALKFTTIEPIRSPQAAVIDVTITPINPPINIPATGGSFQYTANVTNTGTQTTVFDFWINVTEPNGQTIGPFQYKPNLEFDPGQTVQRTMTQYVPGRAPAGVYTYTAKVGDYTASVVWDSSYFNFTKLGADGTGGGEWTLSGWDEGSTSTNIDLPETYVLSEATPNPFNPVTEISYALPQAGRVTLTVFNSRGQQVAVLQDGWSEAGWHKVVFDATALSSGLYLYNIKANDFTQTRKMLLVK